MISSAVDPPALAANRLSALVLVAIGIAACHGVAHAAQPAGGVIEAPPPQTHYMGRRIARTMHFSGASWLTRESREREEQSTLMLENLGVLPGMTVCDMGCGNGYHSLRLAKRVGPRGKVLAVDIQSEMLRLLKARAQRGGLNNITPVLSTPLDPQLPKGKVDLILCVDVYHEFSHPERMLRAMRESLSAKGQLVLVEYREEDPRVPIKPLHKMSKRQILKELLPNGYRLVREFNDLPWQHMMFFRADAPRSLDPQRP
jgi:ubiquinone/menaquinone biosynthesis C-methylase UbiE